MSKLFLIVFCANVLIVYGHFLHPLARLHFYGYSEKLDPNVQIKVTPNVLTTNGDWVTCSWRGVANPSGDDWIAIYSPSNVNFSSTAPVKYQYANASELYTQSGNGTLKFRLINLWADYIFVFYRNGTDHPILTAVSNTVTFTKLNVPLQGHLALTEDPSQMRISWASADASPEQQVKWGTESGVYTYEANATTYTYTREDMCGDTAKHRGWRDPGYLHTAIMTKLVPGQKYYYIYGAKDTCGFSTESSFYAAPTIGPDTSVTFTAYGDLGKAEPDNSLEQFPVWEETPAINTTKNVLSYIDETDLILHIGDISYAVGYSAEWNEFMDEIEPVATQVPYMTCIGNHERDFNNSGAYMNSSDSGGECGVPYENRFPMPGVKEDEPWYSFNYGNIHFVLMSTEHDFRRGSKQYSFLKNDLENVDRTRTPWIIFSGHRPMYIDSTNFIAPYGDQPVAKLLRANLEDLLVRHKVQLAFWGHHHSYQRTCHVYNEKCGDSSYPVHIVIGMAGCGLSQNLAANQPLHFVHENDQVYGFSRVSTTATTLHFQYFTNQKPDTPSDELYLTLQL